ncbi:LacI family DNA-binding transcriptional regulator [Flavobacteriaceae bacterium 3-367]|uniref:LacI family DNA-binding transcriptional regulator n=1 Tax=Eudoraea algarum TaxID=3417568 RepID=UPI003284260E
MAGIKDIAKKTGLSLATVSRVFNNSPLVSPKTREKVFKAAREMDYQPNMMAAALRSGKSKIIGVIVPEVNNPFFSSIINGIELQLRHFGYNIIIAQSHDSTEDEAKALESFVQLKADGILMSLAKETTDFSYIQSVMKKEIPMVFFDRVPELDPINSVVLNDFMGAHMATQHLLDQGCRNLIHIAGDQHLSIFKQRKEGFLKALKEHHLPITKDTILELTWDMIRDTVAIKNLLLRHPEVDGFFTYGDEGCLYLMNVLKPLKVDIPSQIKLMGFGNTDFSGLVDPKISTVDQKCNEMGLLAAEMLMKNLKRNHIVFTQEVLSPQLVLRESTQEG